MLSLIFGAGASYGSEAKGVPTPPQGDYLFGELEKLNGAFSGLPEEIKHEFREKGFEQGMLIVPNDSSIINPLQKELALYLSAFKPSENNVYVKLFRMLGDLINEIHLMTLNYDLLIEQSLAISGVKYVRYGVYEGEVSLLKVHGSSNFVPDVGEALLGGMTAVNCGSFIRTDRMICLNSHDDIQRWCDSAKSDFLSPMMCMYNKEKRAVINKEMIEALKSDFIKAVTESETVVIVGVKYVQHDHHIWDAILDSKADVIVVDPKPDEELISELKRMGINTTIIERPFGDCVMRLAGLIRSKLRTKSVL
ncbi:SIR2 family protein [Enterobacter hormaechei]|uniref:SIR2 family protein n=1 Tax=Enterobacter hormaechei TaxID=158836 RepID=UPI001F34915E|nr:SIR2 family protein [Enterobacter hormaechei]MCF2346265.1 SIR2 family protein [Enterobacter hormaechei]MCF2373327.1 SIR2 family protein [Enterobacter hormaechei]